MDGATLPQVRNDPVRKRNPKLYHSFVRGVKSRGKLSVTLSPLEHVNLFLSFFDGFFVFHFCDFSHYFIFNTLF